VVRVGLMTSRSLIMWLPSTSTPMAFVPVCQAQVSLGTCPWSVELEMAFAWCAWPCLDSRFPFLHASELPTWQGPLGRAPRQPSSTDGGVMAP